MTAALKADGNLLIAAPTGAGKTNIAIMAILQEVSKHINKKYGKLADKDFKVIYISPMKALAS